MNGNGFDGVSLVLTLALSLSAGGGVLLFRGLVGFPSPVFCFCDLREVTGMGSMAIGEEIQESTSWWYGF